MAKPTKAVKSAPATAPAKGKPQVQPKAKAKVPAARDPETVAKKPARPTRPSLPSPPPPPPPPPTRAELDSPRDIGRLLRHGEQFGAANRIDTRPLQLALPIAGTQIAVVDPANPKSFRVLDRPTGSGQFRVMLSVARTEGKPDRLAAAIIHLGRPPIAKWSVAHYAGGKPPKPGDPLPRILSASGALALVDAKGGAPTVIAVPEAAAAAATTATATTTATTATTATLEPAKVALADGRTALVFASGKDEREGFAAYWAVDANDKAVCLVLDFEAFTQKDWKARSG